MKEYNTLIKHMEMKGQNMTFSWPQREDECHIPFVHVLHTVPASSLYGRGG
jgi:hypothetical protein